jgi:hypothetical protein
MKLLAKFASPIFIRARASPMVRTNNAMRCFWRTKTWSIAERTRARAAFALARGPERDRCGGRRNCRRSPNPRRCSADRLRLVRYAVSAHTGLAVFVASSRSVKLRLSCAAASVTVQLGSARAGGRC